GVSPLNSVMYMDGLAWSKYQALTVFSPIVEANVIGWQRKLEEEDKKRLFLVYGTLPDKIQNPCWFYDKYPNQTFRLTPEEMEEAKKVEKCDELIDSRTTLRTPSTAMAHFGVKVSYECQNKKFVMLGDKTRKCMRNGKWTGMQPICMPPELVNSFCTYSSGDSRCERFLLANKKRTYEMNESVVKRSVEKQYKQFESEFVSKEMNSSS
ncbi:hypothetical protein B4U80_12523, partial [Leptotrombidium deliense]